MKFKEIQYNEDLWNKLWSVVNYESHSLHVDVYTAVDDGKLYRLFLCGSEQLRFIEVFE